MSVKNVAFDWIDPYRDDTTARLRELFERGAGEGAWHLLLDMAFAPELHEGLAAHIDANSRVVLYEGMYEGDDLLAISPCLVRLPDDIDARMALCEVVLRESAGRPMLSLLHGVCASVALAAHLRGQMEAQASEDDEAFLVRFADTRCLPVWLDVLTAQQRARFIAGIDAWWMFDRTGALVALDRGETGETVDESGKPYVLDARQIGALREAARIDTLIYHVRQRPESFGTLAGTPSQIHSCVNAAWTMHEGTVAGASRVALDALEAAGLLAANASDALAVGA
nr:MULTISPECIES: DUF4123 domain-containing protein [unclassified Paraburkholderia]